MDKEKKPVALFDFDNTISRGDSIVPFLLYVRKKGLIGWGHIAHACWAYLMQKLNKEKTVQAKEISFSFLTGKSEAELQPLMKSFWEEVLLSRLKPGAMAELQRLEQEGWTVLVVSASADAYMRLLPFYLPVNAVLSTHCMTDENGHYTGKIESNCRGEEKVKKLQAWFEIQDWEPDWEASCAYGDSAGDCPMLSLTGHPVWVDASPRVTRLLPQTETVCWKQIICRSES